MNRVRSPLDAYRAYFSHHELAKGAGLGLLKSKLWHLHHAYRQRAFAQRRR
jgi:hypothetical protein